MTAAPGDDPPSGSQADDWDDHWQCYAAAASLNPAQAFRRELVLRELDLGRARAPVRVLELGSGQGDFALELLRRYPGIELVGLDRSQTGVAISQRKAPAAAFFMCDLEQPFGLAARFSGWATHAVCSEVLEHVGDPAIVLQHLWPWLAPGGKLVITVPGGPKSAFDRHIGHRRHFDPRDLAALLQQAGFDVVRATGAGFPFFNLYRLAVIASAERLVRSAGDPRFAQGSGARLAARIVERVLHLSRRRSVWGWQRVACAIKPEGGTRT